MTTRINSRAWGHQGLRCTIIESVYVNQNQQVSLVIIISKQNPAHICIGCVVSIVILWINDNCNAKSVNNLINLYVLVALVTNNQLNSALVVSSHLISSAVIEDLSFPPEVFCSMIDPWHFWNRYTFFWGKGLIIIYQLC